MTQSDIFEKGEGDEYFKRNLEYLNNPEMIKNDPPLSFIKEYNIQPKNILEIGAMNGFRLNEIYKNYKDTNCVGIEPSKAAVLDGHRRFPHIKLVRGLVEKLSFKDNSFDLVIINFVFHWIDRASLFLAVSEIDRVLDNGGFLIIGDFHPDTAGKFAYKHLSENQIFTYTQNYPGIFIASELYALIGMISGIKLSHYLSQKIDAVVSSDRRMGFFLLKKDLYSHYNMRTL